MACLTVRPVSPGQYTEYCWNTRGGFFLVVRVGGDMGTVDFGTFGMLGAWREVTCKWM